MQLNIPLCTLLAQKAEAKAQEIKVPMVIAFTDDRGDLLHFSRMAGALPASIQIAISKAYTSAALRMETERVGALAQPGQTLYGIQNSMERPIALFGGGKPLCIEEKVVGAVGISGGTVEEDVLVAGAVTMLFEKMAALAPALFPMVPRDIQWTSHLGRRLNRAFEEPLGNVHGDEIDALMGAILLS